MAPTTRETVRPTGDRGPIVLPGQRRYERYERSRPPVAGQGLRLVRLLEPVSVVRWAPWLAARLALPLGLVLAKRQLTVLIVLPMGGGIEYCSNVRGDRM